MASYERQRFTNQEIQVDGNAFSACEFDNCVLVFEGGAVPSFTNCTFRNIKIQLVGAAAKTTSYLSNLYESGLPEEVETVLHNAEAGVPLMPDRPNPPPAANMGTNIGRLIVGVGVSGGIIAWVFIMYLTGWVTIPMERLEAGEPLIYEVDFALIPRLPDSLAEQYDLLRDNQLEQLTVYEWADESANLARIPVEEAFTILLENDAFRTGDDVQASGMMPEPAPAEDDAGDMGETDDAGEAAPDPEATEEAETGA